MSTERRSCVSQDPQVTSRLLTVIMLLTGLLCLFGGYLLGRAARPELKGNDMLTYNLTIMAESTYKKAKKIPPKLIHQNELEKIQFRLLEIFNFYEACGELNKYNLADFVRNSMNYQVRKLMRAVNTASVYLDSLSHRNITNSLS